MAVVHLAIAQFRPRKGDVDGNIRRMGEILAQAASLDPAPHVVQFAETVPSGYFKDVLLDALAPAATRQQPR